MLNVTLDPFSGQSWFFKFVWGLLISKASVDSILL